METKLKFIKPEDYPEVLHTYIPHMERFLKRSEGETSIHSLMKSIWNLHFQVWGITDMDDNPVGVVITKLDHWVGFTALHVLGVSSAPGVGWTSWMKHHDQLEAFARQNDATKITLWARPGWKRVWDRTNFIAQNGSKYRKKYDVMYLDL